MVSMDEYTPPPGAFLQEVGHRSRMAEWIDDHLGCPRSWVGTPAGVGASSRSRLGKPRHLAHSLVFTNIFPFTKQWTQSELSKICSAYGISDIFTYISNTRYLFMPNFCPTCVSYRRTQPNEPPTYLKDPKKYKRLRVIVP